VEINLHAATKRTLIHNRQLSPDCDDGLIEHAAAYSSSVVSRPGSPERGEPPSSPPRPSQPGPHSLATASRMWTQNIGIVPLDSSPLLQDTMKFLCIMIVATEVVNERDMIHSKNVLRV
jgi:hypothetical protein